MKHSKKFFHHENKEKNPYKIRYYIRLIPIILFVFYVTFSNIFYPNFVNLITAYIMAAGCIFNFVAVKLNNYKMPVFNSFKSDKCSYGHDLFDKPEDVNAYRLCDIYHLIKFDLKNKKYTIISISFGDILIYIAMVLSAGNILNILQNSFI
jgi:hypothetical protein